MSEIEAGKIELPSGVERKLTTILAADAESYSRKMGEDEVRTYDALHTARAIFSKFIDRHNGRIANTAGDGLIAEFPSVVEAVQCAIEVQGELGRKNRDPGGALSFRIGIHLGDVIVDGNDLLGEGVNLAARLQTMAEPGGVLISQQVYDQVQSKLSVGFEYLGEKRPKNFAEDVPVYGVALGGKKRSKPLRPRKARSRQPPKQATSAPIDLKSRVIRHAKLLTAVWVVLVAVDLATGAPFWAHWPGLAIAVLVALEAAPLLERSWFRLLNVRGLIILCGLLLINVFTWSGYPWALWPAGALIAVELIRRLSIRTR